MRKRRWYVVIGVLAVAASLTVAGLAMAGSSSESQSLTKVTLQSKWVVQSQFAGYYAAKAKGYYKQVGLDVNIKAGGPDILPEQVVLGKQAEFGINWMPSTLAQRDTGNDLVNIAQVYARSGTTEVTFKKSGINTFRKMRGKKFGVWIFGNEFEQRAALVKNGMNPDNDVQLVKQNFDMLAFLNGEIDAASAMTYNELAQVLEVKNPDTGKLYKLSDLNVFKYSDLGTGMLQDGVIVRGDWIKDAKNQDTAVKFLEASFRGWIYCRDHLAECTNIVLDERSGAAGRPSALADERGQRAHLAEQARDRDHGSGRVQADGDDREDVQGHQEAGLEGLLPHRSRAEGDREPEEEGRRRARPGLQEEGRRPQGGREVANESWAPGRVSPARSSTPGKR